MCLILFAWDIHPQYRLVVLANRDEFYPRPALPAAWWPEKPHLLAGRDVPSGGTWLGVSRSGRFAALTNVREPQRFDPQAPSRGALSIDFLDGRQGVETYLQGCAQDPAPYNGYNLLVCDGREMGWYCNRGQAPRLLPPGIYGLSNALLDSPWPKVRKGKAALAQLLESPQPDWERAFEMLRDPQMAPDEELPNTGVSPEWERMLSAAFIVSPGYGTRCSTLFTLERSGMARFEERVFVPGPPVQKRFEFWVEPAG